jgi:hypothetical protein
MLFLCGKQIYKIIDTRISFYKSNIALLPQRPLSKFRHLKKGIQNFHNKFILTPADKASNNVIIMWRLHYFNIQTEQLHSTYAYTLTLTSSLESDIVAAHTLHIAKISISIVSKLDKIPTMYWLPKCTKHLTKQDLSLQFLQKQQNYPYS